VGFDFLGFTVRQFRVGKHHTAHNGRGQPLGFKTLIKPSKTKTTAHHRRLNEMIRKRRTAEQKELIARLNPVIRGWTNYFRIAVSKAAFSKLTIAVLEPASLGQAKTSPQVRTLDRRPLLATATLDFGTKDMVPGQACADTDCPPCEGPGQPITL